MSRPRRGYLDPYLAGVGIGIVLVASFLLMGEGLGASGAFAAVANQALGTPREVPALLDWRVWEIGGVVLGAIASAWWAGRIGEPAGRATPRRIWFGLLGGAAMGFGARLARGCTSGLALSGASVQSVGAWIFIASAFAAGYLIAPLIRRNWGR
ncbi:MAG: YeeE/YedE thiosulfate transporter family protein [Gemmatimonadales bacterium]